MATTAQKLNKLNGGSTESANSKNLMYPSDLLGGTGQDLVYMTLFINTIRNGEAKLTFQGGLTTPKNRLKSAYGEVPVIHQVSKGLQGSNNKMFSNTFIRSDTSITLPMPKNLTFNSSVRWSNTELGAAAMGIDQATDLDQVMASDTKGLATQIGMNTVGSIASKFANGAIKGKELVELGTATVQNTYSETLFKGVDNRTFSWSWTLTPRNAKESAVIENILRVLRFHQLPEFRENLGNGNAFLLYPSSFDIMFWLEGQPNRYIPRISTCALTGIETNYTPNNGFVRMQNGSPQSYTLTLNFAELSILHKGMVGGDGTGTNTTF